MDKYTKYRAARVAQEQAFAELTVVKGRLRVGPSNDGGIYISDIHVPAAKVPNLTREEAKFLVAALADIYDIEDLEPTS